MEKLLSMTIFLLEFSGCMFSKCVACVSGGCLYIEILVPRVVRNNFFLSQSSKLG